METAALRPGFARPVTPPEWLDRIVRLAIPPAAREAVMGDLWETCQSPAQYAREAFRTVPHLVFSQMCRHMNPPVLMLQGVILYACLGAWAAGLSLPVLMLAAAWQPATRPSPRRAMREAIMLAFTLVVLQQILWGTGPNHPAATVDGVWLAIGLFFFGPCLSPLLCLLRTGLIVRGDRRPSLSGNGWDSETLTRHRARFWNGSRNARHLEAAGLAAAGFLSWRYLGQVTPLNHMLALFYALAALFLMLNRPNRAATRAAVDFLTLRTACQRDLVRQQQLRCFLWWLWCAPVLLMLHADTMAIAEGTSPADAMLPGMAAIMLCFFVSALNREGAGWTQEQIRYLDRMRETA